jgi:hypothetical protein
VVSSSYSLTGGVHGTRGTRWADLASIALIVLGPALLLVLSGERTHFGYGTETDYVGSMVSEARRLLAGDPLLSEFHPPGYIVTMALAYLFSEDWFVAGKAISLVSAAVALAAAWGFFRLIATPVVAFGAVIGLLSSSVFLEYAMQATSDVCFLALYYATFLVAAVALVRRVTWLWVVVGALVIVATMTRTNGITLLLLIAMPFFLEDRSERPRAFGGAVAGVALAICAFYGFALITGSNLMPEGTYHNIALTYFTDERVSWEGMVEARSRFNSLAEVLTHDPVALATGYARDLVDVTLRQVPTISGTVLALFFLPGLLLALGGRHGKLFAAFFAITLAQLLLVNLKAYEPRYHLYLAPWIGAGAMICLVSLAEWKGWHLRLRAPFLMGSFAIVLVGSLAAWNEARRFAAQGGNPELSRVLPEIRPLLASNDVIISRKAQHLSYYTGAVPVWLGEIGTEEDLLAMLHSARLELGEGGSVYLFYGQMERRLRPEVGDLVLKDPPYPWLKPVAGEAENGNWILFRYLPEEEVTSTSGLMGRDDSTSASSERNRGG